MRQRDYEALAAFRHTLRAFLRFSEQAAEAAGSTSRQYQALLALKAGRGRLTVGGLAEELLIRHHSAVGLVNRLAAEGLAARHAAPGDRRRVWLALTPRGESLLRRLAAAHRDELRRIVPTLRGVLGSIAHERR